MARRLRWVLGSLLVAACSSHAPSTRPPAAVSAPAAGPLAVRVSVSTTVFGRSVDGRPLMALVQTRGPVRRRVLVVGCIHGDECAGIALVDRLRRLPVPVGVELVTVENVDPDGAVRRTRTNADGVDLNRNFPLAWRPLDHRGGSRWSGPSPLSEPESRAVAALIRRVHPDVTVWLHQALDVVDVSGGSVAIERRFASVAGMRLLRLPRYPGSVASWQNATFPGTTAFVVELPGTVDASLASRLNAALSDLLRRHG